MNLADSIKQISYFKAHASEVIRDVCDLENICLELIHQGKQRG